MGSFHVDTGELKNLASHLLDVSQSLNDEKIPANPGMTVLATTALTSSFDVFRDEGDERIRGLAKWLRGISVAVSDTRKQNERHDEDWALSFTWDKNKYQTGDY